MRKKLSVLCTTFLLPLLMTVLAFAADSPFSDVAPDAPCAESIAYTPCDLHMQVTFSFVTYTSL